MTGWRGTTFSHRMLISYNYILIIIVWVVPQPFSVEKERERGERRGGEERHVGHISSTYIEFDETPRAR